MKKTILLLVAFIGLQSLQTSYATKLPVAKTGFKTVNHSKEEIIGFCEDVGSFWNPTERYITLINQKLVERKITTTDGTQVRFTSENMKTILKKYTTLKSAPFTKGQINFDYYDTEAKSVFSLSRNPYFANEQLLVFDPKKIKNVKDENNLEEFSFGSAVCGNPGIEASGVYLFDQPLATEPGNDEVAPSLMSSAPLMKSAAPMMEVNDVASPQKRVALLQEQSEQPERQTASYPGLDPTLAAKMSQDGLYATLNSNVAIASFQHNSSSQVVQSAPMQTQPIVLGTTYSGQRMYNQTQVVYDYPMEYGNNSYAYGSSCSSNYNRNSWIAPTVGAFAGSVLGSFFGNSGGGSTTITNNNTNNNGGGGTPIHYSGGNGGGSTPSGGGGHHGVQGTGIGRR
jgi:hypothetical protein